MQYVFAYTIAQFIYRSKKNFCLNFWSSSIIPVQASFYYSRPVRPGIPVKASSIIPVHKMGKPLDSLASFRPIPLTSCVSKLFERIILSHLLFFLESNLILFPRQAGFRPGWSTPDQILYLSQFTSDGFSKPGPGSRTILSTIDFSKAFDSVWHPALLHKLISAGLPPCFARWI